MKKITLSIGLVAAMFTAKSQDTLCTYFTGDHVFHVDYQQDTILSHEWIKAGFYEVNIKYGDILRLDLNDKKSRIRKVITTLFDGSTRTDILNSEDDIYFTPRGTVKVLVGKPLIYRKKLHGFITK